MNKTYKGVFFGDIPKIPPTSPVQPLGGSVDEIQIALVAKRRAKGVLNFVVVYSLRLCGLY